MGARNKQWLKAIDLSHLPKSGVVTNYQHDSEVICPASATLTGNHSLIIHTVYAFDYFPKFKWWLQATHPDKDATANDSWEMFVQLQLSN